MKDLIHSTHRFMETMGNGQPCLGNGAARIRAALPDGLPGLLDSIQKIRACRTYDGFRLSHPRLHERPIAYVVQDQIPVSNNQEIKVDLLAKPQPTKRDIEDKRGVLAWEDRLNPDEEKTIELGWRVSWPAAKSLVYGR